MERKIGANLHGISYTGILAAISAGKLAMTIPTPLLRLLGLRRPPEFE